jgi:HPt (histidine-containing phosphotransfer) domain-containing protein
MGKLETNLAGAPAQATSNAVIDLDHLARMTLGEAALGREVLLLFDRQADLLLARMRNAERAVAAAYAHTLKGSARGIGAWRVAEAAAAVEAAAAADQAAADQAVARLSAAVDETKALIADMVKARSISDATR